MYYIMTIAQGSGLSATYKYLLDIEAGTGASIKKTFPTLEAAQKYVKNEMVASGLYSLNSFIVAKEIQVTADITLTEETSGEGGNG